MKKTEEKKVALVRAYEEKIIPFGEVCKTLGISRQTAYTWLAVEGIEIKTGHAGCRSKSGRFARENGISLPTARKYIAAQERLEKEGRVRSLDLKEAGISANKQKSAVAF